MIGNETTLGTCSICGGPVVVPTVYWSIVPPVPTCSRCGATAQTHGPVIPMQPQCTGTSPRFVPFEDNTTVDSFRTRWRFQ